MKRLIINADDFGYNPEITDGIIHSHLNGVVTSTTAMANMAGIEYAARRIRDVPNLSIGAHLTLTQGRPIMPPDKVPSLVDHEGLFHSFHGLLRRVLKGKVVRAEIELELSAQMDKLLSLGFKPTHWDSHHHSALIPRVFGAALRVTRRFGLKAMRIYNVYYFPDAKINLKMARDRFCRFPVRLYYRWIFRQARSQYGFSGPDHIVAPSRLSDYNPDGDLATQWGRAMSMVPEGISEFVVHPGFDHSDKQDTPRMRQKRVKELHILTSPSFRDVINNNGIELISYRELN